MVLIRSHWGNASVAAVVAVCQFSIMAANVQSGEDISRRNVRESFRFDAGERHVLIPVHLGAQDYLFAVDTGSTGNVFDISLRSHLGKRVGTLLAETADGETQMGLYEAASDAKVGSLPLPREAIACEDFKSFREGTGEEVYGILGLHFLNEWIITIDFDEGRLDFLVSGTSPSPEWGECVRVSHKAKDSRYIPVALGKDMRQYFFMVDTGFPDTGAIEGSLFHSLNDLHDLCITGQTRGGGLSNVSSFPIARVSQFRVGTFQHENLRLTSRKNTSILGLGYLRRFRVTIDFPGERVYLAPGKRFSEPDRGSMCGTHFLFKPDKVVVDFVDEKSPAYAAGVREKDVLVRICGTRVSELRPSAIRQLLSTEGKAVTMTLQRDGKEVRVSLTLKEYEDGGSKPRRS